jgi:CheY-like chemotaxis protein
MLSILFFEDYPYASENHLFRSRLRLVLGNGEPQITQAKTVPEFERAVRKERFDVIILDIMARAPRNFVWGDSKNPVADSLTGVELLRRCRNGIYGYHYKSIPIYMRTARGETSIRNLCAHEGATGYYQAGAEDTELIDELNVNVVPPAERGTT